MGLVDYSESESDSEPVAQPAPAPTPAPAATTASGKKPFQKIIDRSQPGKIRVSLPQTSSTSKATDQDRDENEPPAKRARVGGGGGAFSGFNSFLPPPKNTRKPVAAAASSSSGGGKPAPRPGINLKTGAAPGFSREVNENDTPHETGTSGGDAEPPTKQPSIPAEQKPADEVKLVGKPLMFKPLSVSRKPGKKNAAKSALVSKAAAAATPSPAPAPQTSETVKTKREVEVAAAPPPPKKQKVSLFSIPTESADDAAAEEESTPSNGVYEPMFSNDDEPADAFAAYDQQYSSSTNTTNTMAPNPTAHTSSSLSTIAADMNLSASARRELFGRGGVAPDAGTHRLVTFDTTVEYDHNEALRTSGAAQQPAYNPLRGLAPGKHSLRQLVTQAQSHREALEDSFAQGKSHRSDAGARYGWR